MAKRLLVVDDNQLILRVVADFFVPHGWDVTTATDAEEGLRAIDERPVDAVVSDILMPGMDGWAFCDAVRSRPRGADLPFVFLTVERELPARLRGLHQGADDYVTKPFDVEELHARVERLVERRRRVGTLRLGEASMLTGTTEHLALADLLQILALNGKSGTVELKREDRHGRIEIREGRIVDAECDRTRGVKALHRLLGWSSATFEVTARSGAVAASSIEGPASTVIMDALVANDEWRRHLVSLPDQGATCRLVPDARERLTGRAVTAAEFDVMSRARRGLSIGEIVEESPFPDAAVAEALTSLLERRILVASPRDRAGVGAAGTTNPGGD